MGNFYIEISKDYTKTPGGRFEKDGPNSGEVFRKNLLYPMYVDAIEAGCKLTVNLDGCFGYPSSFIDEAFGGLAKEQKDRTILNNIIIISNDQPGLIDKIRDCIENADIEV